MVDYGIVGTLIVPYTGGFRDLTDPRIQLL